MKTKLSFLSVVTILFTINLAFGQVSNFITKTDVFMKKHVINGSVNYNAIHENSTKLNELLSIISILETKSIAEPEKKAYLINVYNLLVIHQINMAYPINSPMDIAGFFDKNKFDIGGEKITLNYLENKVIRPTYKDPRLHFVLVCGAKGCPVIENFAYNPDEIEMQIEVQTIKAINSPDFIKIDGMNAEISVSEIFSWYAEDFRLESKNDIQYINKYRKVAIPEGYKTKYYTYDWSLNELSINTAPVADKTPTLIASTGMNLQTYTAGSLLKKGQMDITLFNSVYTETKTNWLGIDYSGFRSTFANSLIQFTYGVSKNARFNVGVDLSLKSSAKSSDNSFSGITAPFKLQNNDTTRAGLAYIAPKIKISPFKGSNDFSIQSTFITSFTQHPEGYSNSDGSGNRNLYWLEWDRYIWWTQLYYTKSFANDKLQLFTELDFLFRFAKRKEQTSHIDLPVSAFLSWFPSKKFTLYVMTQHVPRFVYDTKDPVIADWVIGSNYTQSGVGLKYQIVSSVNIELLYTNFWRSVNGGQGETFNLGIKYVH
ncbi:MAG: DUF547 domain-containing protein [Flavobacteriales bacterium]|nr:DUF547 domain-containing protein [Flavobacteriales bacterium]